MLDEPSACGHSEHAAAIREGERETNRGRDAPVDAGAILTQAPVLDLPFQRQSFAARAELEERVHVPRAEAPGVTSAAGKVPVVLAEPALHIVCDADVRAGSVCLGLQNVHKREPAGTAAPRMSTARHVVLELPGCSGVVRSLHTVLVFYIHPQHCVSQVRGNRGWGAGIGCRILQVSFQKVEGRCFHRLPYIAGLFSKSRRSVLS